MSMSTGYVRAHIYIEDMRTKKALSAWISLVSVFCSSGAISSIRGKQITPAITSKRSIFSKNHDYNTYNYKRVFRVAVNTYVPILLDIDVRGGRKLRTDTQHTHAGQPQ